MICLNLLQTKVENCWPKPIDNTCTQVLLVFIAFPDLTCVIHIDETFWITSSLFQYLKKLTDQDHWFIVKFMMNIYFVISQKHDLLLVYSRSSWFSVLHEQFKVFHYLVYTQHILTWHCKELSPHCIWRYQFSRSHEFHPQASLLLK